MEDFLMREIEKIGALIAAILGKLKTARQAGQEQRSYDMAKRELLEALGLDIDTLLESDRIAETLGAQYGFSDENLEKFAELLFDILEASEDEALRRRLSMGIGKIYEHIEKSSTSCSLDRHYILNRLREYKNRD